MPPTKRLHAAGLVLALGITALGASAQTPLTAEQAKARLDVGAAFLKAGDRELALKTFVSVADADPTNWQARSLLALAYLSMREFEKADAELKRVKILNAPASTVATLERQIGGALQARQQRDQLAALLNSGRWQDAQTSIAALPFPEPRKQLLRAYVAGLRGEFDEARRLASDPQYQAINASLAKRAEDFQAARERALVAFNVLGFRYCGNNTAEMRWCVGQAPLKGAQQAAWNEVRAGGGKVDGRFMREKAGFPQVGPNSAAVRQEMNLRNDATLARIEVALRLLTEFALLAPFHPDSLRIMAIVSLYSGSQEAVREAADRSLHATGTWMISTRECANFYRCSVGDDKVEKLEPEGVLVVDARARVIRYHTAEPQGWLTGFAPRPAAKVFEIPFDKVTTIRSRPVVKSRRYGASYVDDESVVFDFGPKQQIATLPDFTLLLKHENLAPTMIKAIDNLANVLGQLMPAAKVDSEAIVNDAGGGGFMKALGIVAVGLGTVGGDASLVQQGNQNIREQRQQTAAVDALRQSVGELKTQDGQSIVDIAFEEEGLKTDLDALLALVLQ